MNEAEKSRTIDPLFGGLHIDKSRMQEFALGHVELEDDELAHVTLCERCSHHIADLALTQVEQKGDQPRLRKMWDKLFG